MRFQQSGTVYAQFGMEISNQIYSNVSATAASWYTPLFWTEMMYCIRADMSLKYLDHCLSSALAEQKAIFSHSGKIPDLKEQVSRSQ